MSKKKNSNLPFTIKLVVATLLMAFLAFSIMNKNESHLTKVSIKIKTRSDKKYLISKKEVRQLLVEKLGYDLSIAHIDQLDLLELESHLEADDRINRAEMFIDKHNKMVIGIIQNLPIVRVDVTGGEDYYLDAAGEKIPRTGDALLVPIVTGSVDKYEQDFKSKKENNLNYVLALSNLLYDDEILGKLIDQIHVDENDEIVIVPRMGRQHINLGPAEGLNDKMYKLKTYYKNGIKNIGIDRFDKLDLQYTGQIVGSKSES